MKTNFLDITLECNGLTMQLGMSSTGEKRPYGITKITGLEASEFEISTTDNALVDGSTVDGKRIKNRPIHIEATLRDDKNNSTNRQWIIKFMNPRYTGKMTINHSGTLRTIEYELEGWSFVARDNVYGQLSFVVDLICPDPYWRNTDNFGKNMADISKMIAFPWRVLPAKQAGTPEPYKGLTLFGQICGYRTLSKEVMLPNDGDVPTGLQIKFVAARGSVTNPKIVHAGTGKFVRVKIEMAHGDVLLIDTNKRHRVIELNDINVYQKIDKQSDPFELDVGDNYLQYDADVNYTNLDVMLYYTPLYLGV